MDIPTIILIPLLLALFAAYVSHKLTQSHEKKKQAIATSERTSELAAEREAVVASLREIKLSVGNEGMGIPIKNTTAFTITIRKCLLTDTDGRNSVIMAFTGAVSDIKGNETYADGKPAHEVFHGTIPKTKPNELGWVDLPPMTEGEWRISTQSADVKKIEPTACRIIAGYRSIVGRDELLTIIPDKYVGWSISSAFDHASKVEDHYRKTGEINFEFLTNASTATNQPALRTD